MLIVYDTTHKSFLERWIAGGSGLECALDLVNYIKSKYEDLFGIGVAGYPEGPTESYDLRFDPDNQLFYDAGHPNTMVRIDPGSEYESLTDAEKSRCSSTVDSEGIVVSYIISLLTHQLSHFSKGNQYYLVCRNADYDLELDYLKKKIDAGADFIITQVNLLTHKSSKNCNPQSHIIRYSVNYSLYGHILSVGADVL
jgi:methylenetetrahydrofolate reductase (NADPH)